MAASYVYYDIYLDDVLYTTVKAEGGNFTFTEELLPTPSKEGKIFLGWFDEKHNRFISVGDTYHNKGGINGDNILVESISGPRPEFHLYSKWEDKYSYVDESSGAYKSRIQNNNTDLKKILDTILTLGSNEDNNNGVSVEAWTGTVYGASGLGDLPSTLYIYTDETLTLRYVIVPPRSSETITIAANTCVYSDYGEGGSYGEEDTSNGIWAPSYSRILNVTAYIPLRDNFTIM